MHACTPVCPHTCYSVRPTALLTLVPSHGYGSVCSCTLVHPCMCTPTSLCTATPPLHTHTRYTWAQIRACLQPGAHSHSHTVSCTPTPPLHNPSVHTQGCQCACTPTALCTPTSSHILCTWVWTGSATLARVAHPRRAIHPLALGHCLGHACTLTHAHTRPLAHPLVMLVLRVGFLLTSLTPTDPIGHPSPTSPDPIAPN